MPPANNHGQYDFIMNPGKPPKQSMFSGGNSVAARIAVFGGGIVVLFMVFIIGFSLLTGGSASPKLVTIAQEQQEIIRVTTLTNTSGNAQLSQTTKNFIQTCLLSITTAQQQTVALLSSQGQKLSDKELALKQNGTTDQAIAAAVQASTVDGTYLTLAQTQLTAYANLLKEAFNEAESTDEKQLLNNQYEGAKLLLQQLASSKR